MLVPSPPSNALTLGLAEGSLTVLSIAIAFCWPRLGASAFAQIERFFSRLAQRKTLAVIFVGCTALLLRLAILPFCPIPAPFVPDDFSFLLAADTFAHGRLANPTPAMWTHFETIHVTMFPTYTSMYFPAQGLLLAAGTLLFGHPWFGLLIASAVMCAAICWMLQAWMPAPWAMLGGLLAVLHLGLFSYWINTYHAAGSIGATGGALVLGSLPRLKKTGQARYGFLMAIGIVLLALTRPYESLLLCLPVAVVLGHWVLFGKNRPKPLPLLSRATPALLLMTAAALWMAHYDSAAFGKATTLPYTVDRAEYAMAPYFVWQRQRPQPTYRYAAMKSFYYEGELKFFTKIHKPSGFLPQTLVKAFWGLQFFTGIALVPPLFMLHRVIRDRRMRLLVVGVLVLAAGLLIQIFLLPHYMAPFTAAFYALGLQCMRHLRLWMPEGKPVGKALVRMSVTVCLLVAALRLNAGPLHLALPEWPAGHWNFLWYGPDHFGTERQRIESDLDKESGKQLVLVRYSQQHNPFEEWVYNAADLDSSKVIWARDIDPAHNAELLNYYKDRRVWLVEPDKLPAVIAPYEGLDREISHSVDLEASNAREGHASLSR